MNNSTQDIWNSLRDPLYHFILKRISDQDLAKDLLQEVFIKIHLNLEQLKDSDKLTSWAYQITRNQIAEHFRKNKQSVNLDDPKVDRLATEENDFNESPYCCFENFVDELPPRYSEVVSLINIEGKKQQEAADELNLSLANVKSRVHRAKEILKQKFVVCCQYKLNDKGLLVGEQDCQRCSTT